MPLFTRLLRPQTLAEAWALLDAQAEEIARLQAQVRALTAQVQALTERLGRKSANSSRPPSSDPPNRPPCPSAAPSGRPPGGQSGDPGHGRRLRPRDQVDRLLVSRPVACANCGALLLDEDPTPARHQVTEVPAVRPEVIEYQRHAVTCLACGAATAGAWPVDMPPEHFGPRVRATAAYLTGRLGASQRAMEGGFRRVQARLPSPIRELHPDSGSEFLNDHLVRYWGKTITGLTLSRSRPWHKTDHRIVEQKNDTLVRAYLGHWRLDTPERCAAVNALYDRMWLYYNFFQPVLHLVEKTAHGTRVRRRWDAAQTPFDRLLATGVLDTAKRAALEQLRDATNPRALRREIYADLAKLLRAPGLLPQEALAA